MHCKDDASVTPSARAAALAAAAMRSEKASMSCCFGFMGLRDSHITTAPTARHIPRPSGRIPREDPTGDPMIL